MISAGSARRSERKEYLVREERYFDASGVSVI